MPTAIHHMWRCIHDCVFHCLHMDMRFGSKPCQTITRALLGRPLCPRPRRAPTGARRLRRSHLPALGGLIPGRHRQGFHMQPPPPDTHRKQHARTRKTKTKSHFLSDSVRVPRANASRHNDHPSPVLPSVTRGLAHEGITCVIGQSIRHGHPSLKKCFPGVGGGVPCCSTGGSLLSTGNLFVSRWRSGGTV